jgi:hypothetical protein
VTARSSLGALLLAAALAGCGGGAQELLETAKLEELQNNAPHARELYQQILRDYPGSPEAREAESRLKALGTTP